MGDEIIKEVWQAKDRLAKQAGYKLDSLARELRKRQERPGKRIIDLSGKRQHSAAHSSAYR